MKISFVVPLSEYLAIKTAYAEVPLIRQDGSIFSFEQFVFEWYQLDLSRGAWGGYTYSYRLESNVHLPIYTTSVCDDELAMLILSGKISTELLTVHTDA